MRTALEGVDLNAYNANVDFDVRDTADRRLQPILVVLVKQLKSL